MRRKDYSGPVILGGLLVALFIVIAAVACSKSDSSPGYYPHDTTHGYYDSNHHYHYYNKYGSGRKPAAKPAPRPNKPSLRKSSGRRR